MHLGMLGVVGVFTGIISPVVSSSTLSSPFPLTDLQIPAYIILICLAIICILLAVRSWKFAKFFCLIVLGLIGYLFLKTWNGEVRSTSGILMQTLSWGWVFLVAGSGLLISSMFDSDDEDMTPSLSDHLIGWLGAIAILALTGLIISISYSPDTRQSNKNSILAGTFGTGWIHSSSGITQTNPFLSIEKLIFDRKTDSLSFFTSSGTSMVSIPTGRVYDRVPYATPTIGNKNYIINAEGTITTESGEIIWKLVLPQKIEQSLLFYSGNELKSLSSNWIRTFSGEYTTINHINSTKNGNHTVWSSKTGSGYTIFKDGTAINKEEFAIEQINISSDGESIMALVRDADGSGYIMKNGIRTEKLSSGYIDGTLNMNGTESIYAAEHDNTIELIHNGSILDRKFDEIREIFLDRDGGGYVYFGRPLGEQSYCLFTRYRGNLCGLTGYMNPRQSPDGLSVIYAGLKDGNWGIYRNATPIIRNTGYPNKEDISRDYVFFDITNPYYYLFIRGSDDGYRLYKKWAWVEWIWKDVGLDATFGYDNKIIMSVQDIGWWKLIEF